MASVTGRWRWWLVRRRRCRRALVALRDGRADDAFRELSHTGAGDERADVLYAIAAVTSLPTLPNAARCVAALETAGRALDPETIPVASGALAPVLWQGPGDQPEFVAEVAQLTGRLMRVAGSLPWGHYNLAVHALQTGEFGAATEHLAAGAAAPGGGWPVSLLGAACAAVLGESAMLARWLTEPLSDSDVADDHRFLTGVHTVFACLRDDRQVEPAWLDGVFDGPPGPLTQTVPRLAALKTLLACAAPGVPSRTKPADLDGCAWGQWLGERLHVAGGEATEVLSNSVPTEGLELALLWQRLGSQQDLLSLLPEQAGQALRQQFVEFGEHLGADTVWARAAELRIRLCDEPATVDEVSEVKPATCPWWPADGPLQAVACQEIEVERCYLAGRHALRCGQPAAARRWFAQARARLAGHGMATRIVTLRFGPLLSYWEGVVQAHLGLLDEAAAPLRACANGVKAREARAQLGLLALAGGDYIGAADLLATIHPPRPAAADYLAAVLAARDGDVSETTGLLERLDGRELVAGVYVDAGHRLLGRVHEAAGELTAAAQHYRHVLTRRSGDPVAAARLARVWLRQRYDDAGVSAEPLLDQHWSALTSVGWAAPLPLIRDCLGTSTASSARELLDQVPADPAFRLLALRNAIAADEQTRAVAALRTWGEEDDPDPRLVVAMFIARASQLVRDFCVANGSGEIRRELIELEQRLRDDSGEPALAFWAASARFVLSPESVATELPTTTDMSGSASMRLFAGLMSIFSHDDELRRAGARRCRATMAALPEHDPRVLATVRCLAADALSEDREFLAAYREVETESGALPCDVAASYLAATEARLRVGDLSTVIDGFIPEPLADLANPGVRRAMGIAYARRAAQVADADPRAALRDLDQARVLLGEAS